MSEVAGFAYRKMTQIFHGKKKKVHKIQIVHFAAL